MPNNEAKIVLSAEDRFSRTFGQLKRDLSGVGAELQGLAGASRLSGLFSGGGAALTGITLAIAGAAKLINLTADSIDKLNDVKAATGDTIENLSGLDDLARRNGESIDLVTTALVKMNKTLADAKPDSDTAKALQQIGLDATKLRSLAPTQALQELAVALQGFADDGNKARLVQELFGKSLKEVAPFLRELAEAGKLNALVTSQQALEAKKLNDELDELNANATNAARSIGIDLITSINASIKAFREGRAEGKGYLEIIGHLFDKSNEPLKPLFEIDSSPAAQLREELARIDILLQGSVKSEEKRVALQEKRVRIAQQLAVSDGLSAAAATRAQLGGGFGATAASFGSSKPSVGDQTGKPVRVQREQVSEAQRYLETLQKQGEKLQDLTALQQVLKDIEGKRIAGLTPQLAEQIKQEATKIDLQKEINDAKEKEVGFQKLLTDLAAKELKVIEEKQAALDKLFADIATNSRAGAITLLKDTEVGRLQQAEVQLEALRDLMKDPAFQDADSGRAFIEAIEKIKESVSGVAAQGKTEFEKLADVIEKTMDRSTDAILDFVVDGKGSVEDLFKSFSRDILRQFIETPVRDAMKEVAGVIQKAISPAESGGGAGLLSSIFKLLAGDAGASSGNALAFLDQLAPAGAAGFANGGRVKAGSLLRVNENGTETFIPGQDGTILSARQTRARAAGGGQAVSVMNVFNVAADVSRGTVQMLEAMIDRNNAKMQRSARTGGAFAS